MTVDPNSNYPRPNPNQGVIDFGAFGRAYDFGKQNVVPFVVSGMIYMVAGSFSVGFQTKLQPPQNTTEISEMLLVMAPLLGIGMVIAFFQAAVQGLAAVGVCTMMLRGIRRGHAQIEDIIDGIKDNVVAGLGVGLLIQVCATLGVFACCIGSIIAMGALMFSFCEVAEGEKNPVDAIKLSFEKTKSQLLMAVVFALVEKLLAGAGVLLCCIGILFTTPLSICAVCYAYLDVKGATPEEQPYAPPTA